jgi:hypothetical protein
MGDKQSQHKQESPSSAEILNYLAIERIASNSPWHMRLFKSSVSALFFTMLLLVGFTTLYLSISYSGDKATCYEECQKELSFFQKGIIVDEQTLNIELLEYELNKLITPEEVIKTRAVLEKKFSTIKKSLLQGRLATAKVSEQVLSQRLGKHFLPDIAGAMSLITKNPDLDAVQQLYPAGSIFRLLDDVVADNKIPQLTNKAFLREQTGAEAFQEMYALVKLQYEREQQYMARVKRYIDSMDAYMSFEWLSRLPWVVQLVFWTWFGVLINNIVWLIRLTKSRKEESDLAYTPDVYIMLFPRLLIAPFISIIFLAMISSGMASFDISNLNNLPAFLVAAFFLGFMSESITLKIRQFFNKLLDSVETHKQSTLSLADIEPTPSFKPIANTSLSHLETNMRGLVNNEVSIINIRNKVIKKAHLDN